MEYPILLASYRIQAGDRDMNEQRKQPEPTTPQQREEASSREKRDPAADSDICNFQSDCKERARLLSQVAHVNESNRMKTVSKGTHVMD